MDLYVKQRVYSIGDKYDVYNERQEPVFHIQGEIFKWGAKIYLYDLSGKELYFVRQKVLTFLPEYDIFQDENLCASIKKKYNILYQRLNVESSLGNFEIAGDLYYKIFRNGQAMGEVHNNYRPDWGDTYCLSIYDPEDAAFFTALAIAADKCLGNDKNKR